MEFSPDGRIVISSEQNGGVRIWEVVSGRCLGTLTRHSGVSGSTGATICPNRMLIAYSSSDQKIELWDVEHRQRLRTLKGHQGEVWVLAFSPDGRLLASGSLDTSIKLWEIDSGRCLATLQGHHDWIWSMAFSSDGTLLASGDRDGTVKLWKIDSGQCLRTLKGSSQAIVALTFASDDTTLLSSNAQDLVTVWDVNGEHCFVAVSGNEGAYWLRSAAFSPDGRLLAAKSEKTIKVWEVSTGKLLRTFLCHTGRSRSIIWSGDQRLLATGTDEGIIIVWEQQTEKRLMMSHSDRPYERMNIYEVTGITESQRASLRTLGAIDRASY